MNITLTNLISNGSFETNVTGWSGYISDGKGGQSNLAPTRVAKPANPTHTEYGSWVANIGTKTQGVIALRPTANIPTIIGHKYYIRAQIRLRGSTAGAVTQANMFHMVSPTGTAVALPGKGVNIQPLAITEGLYSTNTTSWELIDDIWTADRTAFAPATCWAKTSNGNDNQYGQLDNMMVIDLTAATGEGLEPPLNAIRQAIIDNNPSGYWDGAITITIPEPPVISTETIPFALKGRGYTTKIELVPGTGAAPFSFSINGLPEGHELSIDNNGVITGTCGLSGGTYIMSASVTDNVGYTIFRDYSLQVGEPPEILDTYIPGAVLDEAYLFTPTIVGSNVGLITRLYVSTGTLPLGLSIIDDITISGIPTVDRQTCQITITAVNDYDTEGVSKTFTLTVSSAPEINTLSPLPNGRVNNPYSVTFNASGLTPITWAHLSGSLPNGLTFNSSGVLSGTPTETGTFSFSIKATNSVGEDTHLYTLNIYELPVVTTTTLGYARLDRAYSAQLSATGSVPITFTRTAGTLPTGLTLNETTGAITGTPSVAGTYNFTIVATNIIGSSAPRNLTIIAGNALSIITTSPLRNGTVNVAYGNLVFQVDGVDSAYGVTWSWAPQSGSQLPSGMTFNTTNGTLSGTPTTAGTYSINVTAVNGTQNATSPFSLTIGTVPVITTNPSLAGGIDRPFTIVLAANGTLPITWAMTAGPTPNANISLGSNGVLSWLIPVVGNYAFTIVATNTFGNSIAVPFNLMITTPSITDVNLNNGVVGEEYTHTFTPGGEGPFTWNFVSGSLPEGLSFDTATATISGIPTTTGTSTFSISVTNLVSTAQEQFTITVYSKPIITTVVLNSGNSTVPYSQTLQANGTTPITWSLVTPTGLETGLPPGLNLVGGTISGTPTVVGSYLFTVQASNITGATYNNRKQFIILINPPLAPIITTNATLTGIRGTSYTLTLAATTTVQPVNWTLQSGSVLPEGLSLVGNQILGTPTVAGRYTFTLVATNADGFDTRLFTMTVSDPPRIITNPELPMGVTDILYLVEIEATGDTPITWQLMNPTGSETGLPAGLTFNTTTRVIRGTPTTAGTYTFRIRASNSVGNSTVTFSLTINEPPTESGTWLRGKQVGHLFIRGKEIRYGFRAGKLIYELSLENPVEPPEPLTTLFDDELLPGEEQSDYYYNLGVEGGIPPYTWTVSGLPTGLTTSLDGEIIGIPTLKGTYTVIITVTDAENTEVTKTVTLIINEMTTVQPGSDTFAAILTVPTPANRNNYGSDLGYEFTVNRDIEVYALGRPQWDSMNQNHTISLWQVESKTRFASVEIKPTSELENGFRVEKLPVAIRLFAGNNYRITSSEYNGGDKWYDITDFPFNLSPDVNYTMSAYGTEGAYGPYPGFTYSSNSGYTAPNFYYKIAGAYVPPPLEEGEGILARFIYKDTITGEEKIESQNLEVGQNAVYPTGTGSYSQSYADKSWEMSFNGWTHNSTQISNLRANIDVGAHYSPTDGKTRICHTVSGSGTRNLSITFGATGSGTLTIVWGDGTSNYTSNATAITTASHNYTTNGDFVVEIFRSAGTYNNIKAVTNQVSLKKLYFGNNLTNIDNFSRQFELDTVVFSSSITSMNSGAFEHCTKVKSLVFPNSLTLISDRLFFNCPGLETLVLPSSISSIGVDSFQHCYSIPYLVIPEGVTKINMGAFWKCYGLRTLSLPSTLTENIGLQAFMAPTIWNRVNSLTKILCHATTPITGLENINVFTVSPYAGESMNPELRIYVPNTVVTNYKSSWSSTYSSAIRPLSEIRGE